MGRIIILIGCAIFIILFSVDLIIFVYQHEKELYDEYKRYERREFKRLLKEWDEENNRIEGVKK